MELGPQGCFAQKGYINAMAQGDGNKTRFFTTVLLVACVWYQGVYTYIETADCFSTLNILYIKEMFVQPVFLTFIYFLSQIVYSMLG